MLARLREAVADRFARRLTTSKDFELLSEDIQASISDTLGASTLKRVWEYIEPHRQARVSTLDIMARYAGFKDFVDFSRCIQSAGQDGVSGYLGDDAMEGNQIGVGASIEVEWKPDRKVRLLCVAKGCFEVTANRNSKLEVGAYIKVAHLINGRPMMADVIIPDTNEAVVYEAGRDGGIRWTIVGN